MRIQKSSVLPYKRLFQNEDNVVILTEMIHDRIVPIGERKVLDDGIRLWSGSRGYWDDDTLVVETNFNGYRQTFSSTGKYGADRKIPILRSNILKILLLLAIQFSDRQD